MAVATTGFMAAAGLYGSNLDKIDCSDVLAAILLKDTSFLKQIKMGSPVKNIEHFWVEDKLNAQTFMGALGTSSTTLIMGLHDGNITTSAEFFKIARTGTLVAPEGYDNVVLRVTDIDSTSVVVAAWGSAGFSNRGYTISAEVSSTIRWFVVGQPYEDELAASSDISRIRTRRKNYTQIFERAIEINETRKHVELYAVDDELKLQVKNRTYEIKRELNVATVNGMPYTTGGFSPDVSNHTMMGVVGFIRDYDLDGTLEDTTVVDCAGPLTLTKINTLAAAMYDAGGFGDDSDCFLLVSPYQARVIALLEQGRIRKTSKEMIIGTYANKVMTDLGFELDVITDRFLPRNYVLIIDRRKIQIRPLQGDSWHMEKMAKTGRSEKYQLSGQYTIQIENADSCHGMLRNVDYSQNISADF